MERFNPSSVGTTEYYKPILQRYARRILNDEAVAKSLAKKVLKGQYENNELTPSKHLLEILKADLLNHCYYYKQSQIFDRPLIKVPIKRMILSSK